MVSLSGHFPAEVIVISNMAYPRPSTCSGRTVWYVADRVGWVEI